MGSCSYKLNDEIVPSFYTNLHSMATSLATNSMNLQSTHTPHSQYISWDPHLESDRISVAGRFCGNSQHVYPVCKRATVDATSMMFGNSALGAFHHWGYTMESWTPRVFYFSWFTPIPNTIRCNLKPISRFHFLEGEFTHWVGKAKNVWLIVGRLPIKAEWCHAFCRGSWIKLCFKKATMEM